MKKIFALILALCSLLCFNACNGGDPVEETTTEVVVTQAPIEYEGQKYNYLEYSDHIELIAYKGYDSYVSLPSTINNKPVTSFGKIFSESLTLVSIHIPSTYTEIEEDAFYNAWKLQRVSIQSGNMTKIGANAFLGCQSLKVADIPSTVTVIHEDAFKYCTELIIYGKSGSAAEEFASNFSSIYFRANGSVTTEEASTEEKTTEEVSTEELSTEEISTSEVASTVEGTTEEASTNE